MWFHVGTLLRYVMVSDCRIRRRIPSRIASSTACWWLTGDSRPRDHCSHIARGHHARLDNGCQATRRALWLLCERVLRNRKMASWDSARPILKWIWSSGDIGWLKIWRMDRIENTIKIIWKGKLVQIIFKQFFYSNTSQSYFKKNKHFIGFTMFTWQSESNSTH